MMEMLIDMDNEEFILYNRKRKKVHKLYAKQGNDCDFYRQESEESLEEGIYDC